MLFQYGLNYLNNFLYQYNNEYRFNIYIHISGKSQIDLIMVGHINSNIKYINYIHNFLKFSIEMLNSIYDFMSFANSKYN